MNAIVAGLCRRLMEAPDQLQDTLGDCAELLRNWQFFGGKSGQASVVECQTFGGELPVIGSDEVKELVRCLGEFIKNHPAHADLSSALFCLKYADAPELKPLLRDVLRRVMPTDSIALYQTMIALERQGESLFTGASTSVDDFEGNCKAVEAYLRRWEGRWTKFS